MDNQEAINLLNELLLKGDFTDQYGDMCDSSPYEVAVDIAVKAIEKQIKKTVLKDNIGASTSYIGSCPICNRYAGVNNVREYTYHYCSDCGQALDWSDSDA